MQGILENNMITNIRFQCGLNLSLAHLLRPVHMMEILFTIYLNLVASLHFGTQIQTILEYTFMQLLII